MTVSEKMTPSASVKISPSVLFSIGEIYQRRSESSGTRAIGAILGQTTSSPDGQLQVQINHCFVVPHSEVGDQISINSDYYKQRAELHRKGFGKLSVLVGWFSMQNETDEISEKNTLFINESFSREVFSSSSCPVSVHLSLNISKDGLIRREVSYTESNSKSVNPSSKVSIQFSSNDSFACDVIGKAIEAKPEDSVFDLPNELSFVTAQIQKLKDQLTKLEEVKMMIKNGEINLDANVEKAIDEALKSSTLLTEKAKERLQQESSALAQVCESIREQLEILNQMLTYQA